MRFKFSLTKKEGDAIASKKKKRFKIKVNLNDFSIRWFAALLTFWIAMFVLSYFIYLKRYATRLNTVIKEKEEIMLVKNAELKKLTSKPSYVKYNATRTLINSAWTRKRKGTTMYLISLFNTLQTVDDNDGGVVLQEFQINEWRATFRGIVTSIDKLYVPGGLIDRLVALDFVEKIQIPFYQRWSEWYYFTIDTTIKSYDGA